jgi:MFS transporter, OFA family, oxalate/formate antiporter
MILRRTGVVIAGALVNFCLGIFYAWSFFADGLIKELGWTRSAAMFPYTLELLVFAMTMVFGGWFQDRFGPRRGIIISAILIGLSLIMCAVTATPTGVTFFFGIIFGSAVAFGYSAVMATMIRWFPPQQRGMATGIVLMTLGAAALFWSPLVTLLIRQYGIINAFLVCGITLLVTINLSALAITDPPADIKVPDNNQKLRNPVKSGWQVILRMPSFIIIWLLVGLSSGVGTMFIAHLVQIAELNFNISWGFILVSLFALTNAIGRFTGGILCDRIGYQHTLKVALSFMVAAMLSYLSGWGWPILVLGTLLLGLSYGGLYTSYPNTIAGIFGPNNFGLAYGLVFTAVGIIGGMGPLFAAALAQLTNSYYPIFTLGLIVSLFCFYLVFLLRRKVEIT